MCFTGNLDREIVTNPYYFKTEKHYLRAQISRIHHATKLVPKGQHKVTDREEKSEQPYEVEAMVAEDPEQTIPKPTVDQMTDKANWVHYAKNILRNNKTSHSIPEDVEDREKEIDRLLGVDPYETRLKPIT